MLACECHYFSLQSIGGQPRMYPACINTDHLWCPNILILYIKKNLYIFHIISYQINHIICIHNLFYSYSYVQSQKMLLYVCTFEVDIGTVLKV